MTPSRRQLLTALTAAGTASTAGCLGQLGGSPGDSRTDSASSSGAGDGTLQIDLGTVCTETDGPIDLSGGRPPTVIDGAQATPETEYAIDDIPVRDDALYIGHDRETIVGNQSSGGVGHDGIPSVDEPRFLTAAEAALPACQRVFGVEINGDVRAYPQRILVRHEIANDVVGGHPVAVTYCPLTGTAQGFYRGGAEFGVSGLLVNSNLVMWERTFDTRWSQIAATAVEDGQVIDDEESPFVGRSPREFRLIWTTWGRWRDRHPETLVMSTDTGFARSYNNDPYGSYTPVSGHYALDTGRRPNFPLLTESDDGAEKQVVLGARTTDGAIAFDKRTLLEESVLTGSIGSTPVVAVADGGLATAYVYENPDELEVTTEGDGYAVDGDVAPPGELPLEPIVAFDAMWFAWFGFYPDTEGVGI